MPHPVDKSFSVLLALAEGPATGAEIGQQILGDTLAANYMQNSSLYLLLKGMTKDKLITHTETGQRPTYKPFRLTPKGWKVLERGIPQLESQLQLTRERINDKRYL